MHMWCNKTTYKRTYNIVTYLGLVQFYHVHRTRQKKKKLKIRKIGELLEWKWRKTSSWALNGQQNEGNGMRRKKRHEKFVEIPIELHFPQYKMHRTWGFRDLCAFSAFDTANYTQWTESGSIECQSTRLNLGRFKWISNGFYFRCINFSEWVFQYSLITKISIRVWDLIWTCWNFLSARTFHSLTIFTNILGRLIFHHVTIVQRQFYVQSLFGEHWSLECFFNVSIAWNDLPRIVR